MGFEFNRLGADDAAGDAQVGATKVQTLSTLLQGNVISAEEARQAVKDDPRLGLGFLSDEMPAPDEGADVQGGDELDQMIAQLAGTAPDPEIAAAASVSAAPETSDPDNMEIASA